MHKNDLYRTIVDDVDRLPVRRSPRFETRPSSSNDEPSAPDLDVIEEDSDDDANLLGNPFQDTDSDSSNSDPQPVNMSIQIEITNRFAGKVDENDVDRIYLESYDVNKYLAEVDARIQSKNLTTDPQKIKEAHLLINNQKGDARSIIYSSLFEDITTYADYKRKCREIWQPSDYNDPFFNLINFVTVKNVRNENVFMVEVRKSVDRVVKDMLANVNIVKHPGGKNDQLVELYDIATYLTYGVMYLSLSEGYKNAFKRIELDPTKDNLSLLKNLKDNMTKTRLVTQEEMTYSVRYGASGEQGNSKGAKPKPQYTHKRGNGRGRYQGNKGQNTKGQGQNEGQNGVGNASSYGKSDNYNGNRGGYNKRGRGYANKGNRGNKGGNTQYVGYCQNCGRDNHKTSDCLACGYCYGFGHKMRFCHVKKQDLEDSRQNGHTTPNQSQGQGQNQGQTNDQGQQGNNNNNN